VGRKQSGTSYRTLHTLLPGLGTISDAPAILAQDIESELVVHNCLSDANELRVTAYAVLAVDLTF
jgi:hypothetical protein